MRLILASGSPTRRLLLANAGLAFSVVPPRVDEREAEQPLLVDDPTPFDLAGSLAELKAMSVSGDHPDAIVIGADQTLDFLGTRLNKPATLEEARRQLLALSGETHRLHSSVICVRDSITLWSETDSARLTMRMLTPDDVSRYLDEVGERALGSVGAYQIEGPGIRLFERIDGDYFTILGLPLLPLLNFLRGTGEIA